MPTTGPTPYSPDPYRVPAGYSLTDPQTNANTAALLQQQAAYSNVALIPPAIVWGGEVPPADGDAFTKWVTPILRFPVVDKDGQALDVAGRIYPYTLANPPGPPVLDYSVGFAMIETFAAVDEEKSESFSLTLGEGTYKINPITDANNFAMKVKVVQDDIEYDGFGPHDLTGDPVTITFTSVAAGQGGGVLCLLG